MFVEPTPQPDGKPVLMGAFDVPNSGIQVNGENYVIVNTRPAGSTDATFTRSVLVDYVSNTDFEGGGPFRRPMFCPTELRPGPV